MNTTLKLEELAQFMICAFLFYEMEWSWWWFAGLILAPDISILGYLIGTKTGAVSYNLFHHKGVAILIGLVGYIGYFEPLLLAGIMLYAHSSMDRIFGYGLKYADSFQHTHLGWIGKTKLS